MIDVKVVVDTRAVLDMLEKADGKALREKMANAVADAEIKSRAAIVADNVIRVM